MIGVIRANSLEGLHLASKIASEFSTNENEDIASHFPQLVWALRDVKKIEVKGKTNPSANDYMEHLLSKGTQECQQIKECFSKRECFAFKFPLLDFEKLENLEKTTEDQLRPAFVEETNRLLRFIQEHAKPAEMNGEALTGLSFSSRLEQLLRSILDRNLDLKNLYQYMEKDTNKRVFDYSIKSFEQALQALQGTFPGTIF
jgi:hypothetical protein